MPVALISTSTSPALGPSRSSSTISSGFFASKATAARVFMHVLPTESPGGRDGAGAFQTQACRPPGFPSMPIPGRGNGQRFNRLVAAERLIERDQILRLGQADIHHRLPRRIEGALRDERVEIGIDALFVP